MQTISFNDRNAATGLGSTFIYLFIYLAMMIIYLVLKLFTYITRERFLKYKILKKIFKGLLFETIISLTLEGLIEFLVYSFLNIYTKDFSLNGEILGFIFSIICLYLAAIFVPLALIWAISTKNESQL
jgi:hypothetical protein